jgi:hypothetical protein
MSSDVRAVVEAQIAFSIGWYTIIPLFMKSISFKKEIVQGAAGKPRLVSLFDTRGGDGGEPSNYSSKASNEVTSSLYLQSRWSDGTFATSKYQVLYCFTGC